MPAKKPMADRIESHCKGCGKRILWGVTDAGKRIPLDPTPPTYTLVVDAAGVAHAKRSQGYVSHFSTCPKASEFSQQHKEQTP